MQLDFAVREADYLKADSLYRKLPPPRFDTLQYVMMHAVKTNDVAKQEAYIEEYKKTSEQQPAAMAYRLIHEMNEPAAAARVARAGALGERKPEAKARAEILTAHMDAEQGRVRAAVERLRKTSVPFRMRLYADYASNPLYRIPPEQLAALRTEVLASDSVASGDTPGGRLRAHTRLYRLGVLSCRAGDFAAAAQYAQRLRALETPEHWRESIAMLATEIDAQIDVENGRPQEALKKLQQHRGVIALDIGPPFSWGGSIAMWTAEALFRAQRYEEAAAWFDNVDQAIVADQPHVAYVLLRRAQIADARNEAAKARDFYARFLKLWSNPDPELKPIVDQARGRLAALQEQAG